MPTVCFSLYLMYVIAFLSQSGLTLNSCIFQKVPNTQTFQFQTQDSDFLPYKRHGSIKGNLILHNITIMTGPHAETPWTPKPQT